MLLALDAGGTSTRAVVLDESGTVFGFGRAGGGNPTSRGVDGAVSAILAAAAQAATGVDIGPGSTATLAMAGQQSGDFAIQVGERLAAAGWSSVVLSHDLLAAFCSGTWQLDGYALIAGTGSVAARVRDGQLERVVGGRGWLLGDAGSGFWIGHQTARAVIAALDGQGEETALTPLVLRAAEIEPPDDTEVSRKAALRGLMSVSYGQQPVQLAALAPLAFAVPDDPTARRILVAASAALADLIAAVQRVQAEGQVVDPLAGPIVVAGSVVVHGLLAAPVGLRRDLVPIGGGATVTPVADGVLGAAVLALRGAGVEVDADSFARLGQAVTAARS